MSSLWFTFFICLDVVRYYQTLAIIITPCKVQNLMTQPTYGTSLKSKSLVQIIQIPPVFVQSVMVGICEKQVNQNISSTKMGDFYTCQQRYSVVEVYIMETPTYSTSNKVQGSQYIKPTLDNLHNLRFVREKVIIESGCDFTFNLLPLLTTSENQPEKTLGQAIPQQQKMLLRSPYHQTAPLRKQPGQAYVDLQTSNQYESLPNQVPTHTSNSETTQGRATVESLTEDAVSSE